MSHPPTSNVRHATPGDLPWMQDVLGRAFDDDPVWDWVLPPGIPRRHDRISTLMRMFADAHLPDGEVYVTDDRTAAAVWCPEGKWEIPVSYFVRHAIPLLRAIGLRRTPSLKVLLDVEKAHPKAPHYYLALLGTDPLHQGKGHGGRLIRPIVERADAEGLGCYLESSKDTNVPFYRRFGFEVTGQYDIKGGPTIWYMWRDALRSPDMSSPDMSSPDMSSPTFTDLRYEVDGPIATITLDRPGAANALNAALIDELDAAFDLADADDDVRVVLLAGAGKHFCAGHDLKELFEGTEPWAAMRGTAEGKLRHEEVMYFDRCVRIRDFRKPTIAAVQGACSAAGLMLACMCDLIVAADDARFSNPVLRMSGAGVELLVEPWEMGPRKAKEFLLCALTFNGEQAERYGLVNRSVPAAEVMTEAMEMAAAVALVPPVTAQAVKGTINHMLDAQGQRESWRYHFMVHQFVSNTATALDLMAERSEGGMDHVRNEQRT